MTVLRKSQCAYCGAPDSWYDKWWGSNAAEALVWRRPWGAWYLAFTRWQGAYSKMWHQRFH